MKIGVDANSLTRNFRDGTRRYTEELFNALAKIDKKNEYVFFASKKIKIPNQKNFKQITIPSFPFLKRQFYLPLFAWKQNLDVFHHIDPYGSILLANQKSVVTVHDVYLEKTYPTYRSIKYFIKRYYSELARYFVLKQSKVILVVSKSTTSDMNKSLYKFLKDKIIKVTPLAPATFFKPKKQIKDNVSGYFLCMGSFTPRKNIKSVFKSYSLLDDFYKKNHKLFIIVSTKSESKHFELLANYYSINENISIVTSPSDNKVRSLYQNSMCFIYPSTYEGFGLPILEAMACGCPVITTNYGSTKEVAGAAAILIDPLDTNQIKKQMKRIIETPQLRQRLRIDGLKQVKKFSWTETARKTLNAYNYI